METRQIETERFLQFVSSAIEILSEQSKIGTVKKTKLKEKKEKKKIPKLIMRVPPFFGPQPKRFTPLTEAVAPAKSEILDSLKQFKPSVKNKTAGETEKITEEKKPFDFEELNEIIYKHDVRAVECNGPDKEIIAKTDSGIEKTNIKLSKEKILELLTKISAEVKIPISRLFQSYFSNFSITAVIDEEPKFVIVKL